MKAGLLALDWGSSQLRAFLLDGDGRLLEQRSSTDGASRLPHAPAAFEQALRSLAGDWLHGDRALPVIACGMVGSAHGWREAPYAACPLVLDELHRQAVTVHGGQGLQVMLIPGLCHAPPDHPPDVMRGEETQLVGLLQCEPKLAPAACVVMPGTHSKWVALQDGRVQRFATRMTGELFELLRERSVLGRLMRTASGCDELAFVRGVKAAAETDGGDLGGLLFSVRTLGLFEQLPAESLADYLSGLLIGSEVVCGLRDNANHRLPLVLVGEPALCGRYALAFRALGREASRPASESLAARGLWSLATAAGLAGAVWSG